VQRILDAVPGGVVHVRVDGSIRTANPEALRILGFRFDEVTKRFVSDWEPETIHEDGRPCPAADYPVTQVLTTGKPSGPLTIGVRKPSGDLSWAVFRAEPVLGLSGELTGAVVTFLDITERKRIEEERQRTEEQWRVLVENMPDFIAMANPAGRMLSINRVLPHLEMARVLESSVFDFIDEGSRREYRQSFEHAVRAAETVRTETRAVGPGGRIVWYETQLVPILESGAVARILIVARDATERRAMLAKLAEKERLASVGMLAASVAHEIMNPLTYVLANLDFVVGERTDDEARNTKALVEAREGAQRMQQIVWDLRALGRTSGEDLFYVDVRSVLEIALRISGPEVDRAASVILELQEVPCVLASESRLCQVFINVLVNAAQAMGEREGGTREIRVRTRHDEASALVAIEISDTGEGMSADRIERIFEPFFTTKPSGTGLGLSICRDIIERMGGRIDVTSTPGTGTTFTVWLSTTRITQPSPSASSLS
jgi:PAS domain S-box-containing protein